MARIPVRWTMQAWTRSDQEYPGDSGFALHFPGLMLNTRDEDPGESIPTFQEGKSLAVRWARMKVVTEICQMSRFLPLFSIISNNWESCSSSFDSCSYQNKTNLKRSFQGTQQNYPTLVSDKKRKQKIEQCTFTGTVLLIIKNIIGKNYFI